MKINHITILYCITGFLCFGWLCEFEYFRLSVDKMLLDNHKGIWNNIWDEKKRINILDSQLEDLSKKVYCMENPNDPDCQEIPP